MTIDIPRLKAALEERDRDRTHYEGCEYSSNHRDCAIYHLIKRVEQLEAEATAQKVSP